jgi:DNA-binding CsgD family transcriptional regulator
VLGLLAARRDAPAENPHLDELWRIAVRLDLPDKVVPVVAALAEQAWITGRPDPRLSEQPAARLLSADEGPRVPEPLCGWVRRLREAGVQQVGPVTLPVPASVPDDQPYERALALWDDGSPDALLTALALLDDLDARAVAARVRERMRALGVPVPRGTSAATRANPAGLTDRQLDVLALLVEGLSNADIAARLVIAPKTADHHVSAILGKLAVRSRGEAVAAARRLGLPQ